MSRQECGPAPQLEPLLSVETKLAKLRIRNQTRGTTVADRASIADSSATRRTGLLKHSRLDPGDGLWIVPCEAVHTFGMRFAIDIVFLNKKRQVRKIRHAVGKRRIAVDLLAHSVLELPAGTVASTNTEVGDQLEFEKLYA
ncbi:MAG: DUF192 domain-containing protein [Acidobacteria bacterium]|nr:DUF192 domain-containing protein [Acidobacteriota bacterium]